MRERGVEFDVVWYLLNPLTAKELASIVDAIDVQPADLVRKDSHFAELGLDPTEYVTKEAVIELLVEHPKLMQRPIAVTPSRTILARPKEKILDLL